MGQLGRKKTQINSAHAHRLSYILTVNFFKRHYQLITLRKLTKNSSTSDIGYVGIVKDLFKSWFAILAMDKNNIKDM